MKNAIIGFVLTVLLGGAVASGWYAFKVGPDNQTQEVSENFEVIESKPKAGRILPEMTYSQHTPYERTLIDRYLALTDQGYVNDYLESHPQSIRGDAVRLKYYDGDTILIGSVVCKSLCFYPLSIYNVDTMQEVSKNYFYDTATQNNDYIIWVSRDSARESLVYYKRGTREFEVIPGSSLEAKKESYISTFGIGGETHVITFTGSSTVVADVFDSTHYDNGSATKKLRTDVFNLP